MRIIASVVMTQSVDLQNWVPLLLIGLSTLSVTCDLLCQRYWRKPELDERPTNIMVRAFWIFWKEKFSEDNCLYSQLKNLQQQYSQPTVVKKIDYKTLITYSLIKQVIVIEKYDIFQILKYKKKHFMKPRDFTNPFAIYI